MAAWRASLKAERTAGAKAALMVAQKVERMDSATGVSRAGWSVVHWDGA
jgi:hypothetical protein